MKNYLYYLYFALCLSGKVHAAASTQAIPTPREVAAQIRMLRAQQADEGSRGCAEQPVTPGIPAARPATAADIAEIELLRATSIGDIATVKRVIKHGHDGKPLHNIDAAVSLSRGPAALLARYKLTNYSGMTPLMIAVSKANVEEHAGSAYHKIIELLLKHGADAANTRAFGDKHLRTAYDFATTDRMRAFIDQIVHKKSTCA